MLTETERQSIQEALAEWARTAPDQPLVGFLGGNCKWTPKQLAHQVRLQTPDGKALLELLEHGVRREGLTKVVNRLRKHFAEAS